MFCLPKEFSEKFKQALVDGKIVPEDLAAMSSAQRRAFFEPLVGADNAKQVNAMLESKLILVDQKRGMVTWAKKVAGLTPEVRKDLIAKIEKLDKVLDADDADAFLEDLVSQKLGTDVSFEEAQTILRLTKEADDLRSKIPENAPRGSTEGLAYGLKYVELQNFVRNLMSQGDTLADEFRQDKVSAIGRGALEVAGAAKSFLSAFDNSFFGRQGIKVLYTRPEVWLRNFSKSWSDIGAELKKTKGDLEPMDVVKADIYSRPNALNGLYERMKLDVGIAAEEAFPSSVPEKLPLLGRLFKASETAFQAGALRMRADLADKLIKEATDFGVDFKNPTQAKSIGALINAMTGRGGLGSLEASGRIWNVILFSPKFLSANLNTLTMHRFGQGFARGPARDFALRQSALNLAKITTSIASVLFIADQLNPGSVEWDPRSSKFGKIKLSNTYFDLTGGMGPIVTLASRLVPTEHNGKWSFWSKSATTGKWTDLVAGKYGQQTALDFAENFMEGKLSPAPALLRDIWTGKNFQGEKVTPTSALMNLLIPLPVQSAMQRSEVEDLASPAGLAGLILEGLGLSATTYQRK